jgi:predicted DNA-binding transcriptional regulator YafY
MPEVAYRHWLLLRRIPRAPRKIDAASIEMQLNGDGIRIHRRTLQRDLIELSRIFPLVCDDRSKPYGWSWAKDAEITVLPGVDPHAALTFRLVDSFLSAMLPRATLRFIEPYLKKAKEVLASLPDAGLKSWPQRIRVIPSGQPLLAPKIKPDVLEVVYEAMLKELRILTTYKARGTDTVKKYELSPLALVFRGGIIYLVGIVWDYDEVVQLAMHRIQIAKLTSTPICKRPNFDLDDYIKRGKFGFLYDETPIKLVARFTREAAFALAETPLAPDQQLLEDGPDHMILRATAPYTLFLRGWLMGYGDYVEILEPPSLREEFRQVAENLCKTYRGNSAT